MTETPTKRGYQAIVGSGGEECSMSTAGWLLLLELCTLHNLLTTYEG